MTQHNKQPISPLLKTSYASAFIMGAFILGVVAVCALMFGLGDWQLSNQNLSNIMPILMAITGFFAVGYSVMCVVTSRFFQSIAYKRPNYSHLEY
ncbi:MAG: hypothetical protein COB13_007770 [OCS116 cluster bacterium]|uniref:Uncharacterized protein n=1 Tax=OCS116 cluster bacterium TaxID=2030921 RepID=A0A2A4YZ65_9PROT|nr:hypothetical protein [OCS116 cluster bacterium]